jgi:hypothetical protein
LRAAIARPIRSVIHLSLTGTDWTPAGLRLAVAVSGLYHGMNPGMGWPLAASAGLMERSSRALVLALWPMLPFALLVALVEANEARWQRREKLHHLTAGSCFLTTTFSVASMPWT